MRTITCAHLIASAERPAVADQAIDIDEGRVASIGPAKGQAEPLLALPALVNAHDHGRAVRSSSIGAGGKPLEAWLHYLALFPSVDPYLAAVVALSRSALGSPITQYTSHFRGPRAGGEMHIVLVDNGRSAMIGVGVNSHLR